MQNDQTRKLTNGAMMVALFAILLAVSFYVPIISLITTLFLALPIAWYSAKFDRSASLIVTVISIGVSFFIGGVLAIPLALLYAPLGFVIGDSLRTKKSKFVLFILSSLTLLATTVLQYIAAVKIFNYNPIEELLTMLETTYREAGSFLKAANALPKDYDQLITEMMHMYEVMLPAVVLIMIFITAWLYLVINLPLLRRLGVAVPKFAPFRNMKLPRSILWYYLITLIVSLFVELDPYSYWYMVFANAMLILRILLVLQGISFIHFYIHSQGWPSWVKVVATILALPLQSITVFLGLLDLGFQIRAFIQPKDKK